MRDYHNMDGTVVQWSPALDRHVYPEGFHAFDLFAPESHVGKRFVRISVLRRALHGSGIGSSITENCLVPAGVDDGRGAGSASTDTPVRRGVF